MYKVVKRDGMITEFDISKISLAITKAFEAQQKQYHPSVIDMLALRVTADFEGKIKNDLIVHCTAGHSRRCILLFIPLRSMFR